MKLTREEAIKRHRELWGWLAENPMKEKTDWPGWGKYEDINGGCFLCEYAFESQISDSNEFCKCDYCPVEFEEIKDYPKGTIGYCLGGLFSRWIQTSESKERSRIALLIRDLPEKVESKPEFKFKIGDKVVPVSRSFGINNYETIISMMQKVGYRHLDVKANATFGNDSIVKAGTPYNNWYFLEADLIPYVERPQNFAPENYSYCDTTIELYDRETIYNGPATICIINLEGKEHKGIAKCAPDDTFDEKFGQRLAKTRALIKAYKDLERRLIAKAREG